MPIRSACHGCSRIQRSVARPSARSSNGLNSPSEPKVPRTLCTTTCSPRSASIRPKIRPNTCRRPYGERTSTVGWGRSRVARATHRSASRTAPSSIATRRSRSHTTSRVCARGNRMRRAKTALATLTADDHKPPARRSASRAPRGETARPVLSKGEVHPPSQASPHGLLPRDRRGGMPVPRDAGRRREQQACHRGDREGATREATLAKVGEPHPSRVPVGPSRLEARGSRTGGPGAYDRRP